VLVVAGCTRTVAAPAPRPRAISVAVDGVTEQVASGTSLGDLIDARGLRAEPGRLLSVSGRVLNPHRERGDILLNGLHGVRSTTLEEGDIVTVADGLDVTEGTARVATDLPGLHPTVPQRTLATYPMRQIDTVGRISRELVSTDFRRTGRGTVPAAVALTFDDGPWPGQTREVLRILHRYRARATFFMIGNLMERYPGIVRDVVRAGMPIGDHSWSHPSAPPFSELTPHRLATEVLDTASVLRRHGVEPYLFRPPGGSYDDDVLREARQDGMRTVIWDVDPDDYLASRTRKDLTAYVLRHVRPGSIVLLHDGGGDQHATIGALPDIIKGIRKMGLRLTGIPRG
jgi:peptidoglycan/xylan/chitin deacetylase (PgdA/CDA1 family)